MSTRSIQPDTKRIEMLRRARGWSQKKLAMEAGCAERTVKSVESGRRCIPRTLQKIAVALHVDMAELCKCDQDEDFGPLWRVPALPRHYLARPEHTNAIARALTGEANGHLAVGIHSAHSIHGVHGMGGIGKSVLAAYVAQSDAIRAHFTDGVYWLPVGQTPRLTTLQTQLATALGMSEAAFDSLADGKRALAAYLDDKRVLLVMDDVWNAAHADALDVVGQNGRILMTTRSLDVLIAHRANPHALDIMTSEQALTLLAGWTDTAFQALPPEAERVAAACGHLPVALAMAGAQLARRGGSWKRVLRRLRDARLSKLSGELPEYPYRNVYQVIQASVDQLAADGIVPDAEQCYAELAIFAEDEAVPRDALRVLWGRLGLDDDDVGDLGSALDTYALAILDRHAHADDWHALRLHDIPRAFVVARIGDDAALEALHGEFVAALAARCESGLECGPTVATATPGERSFFFARLPYHLTAAGRADELRALLMSYRWLDAKLRATEVVEVLADFKRLEGLDDERSLTLVRDALRLASHVLVRDPSQLPGQLIGRLGHFESGENAVPAIRDLLDRVRAQVAHPWFCPISPVLTSPDGPLLRTLAGHSSSVWAVALSRDGTRALSGSYDTTLKFWDTTNGQLLRTFEGHASSVLDVGLSHDGTRALSSSYDETLKLWDTTTGQLLHAFAGHASLANAVALSGDGTRALSGSDDGTLEFWDTTSGRLLRTFEGHAFSVLAVALSHDGTRALSGSDDKTLKLWDITSGQLLRTFEGHSSWVLTVALSRDGTRALSGSDDKTLKLWDTTSGQLLRTFEGHLSWVLAVALSDDGTRALSGSDDKTLKLWDTTSGRLLRTFEGHSSSVLDVALSSDGTRALSGADDRTLKLWDTTNSQLMRIVERHSSSVGAVALSGDGTRALSGSDDTTLKFWNTDDGQLLRTFEGHSSWVWDVALSGDGTRALSGSEDRTLKFWDTASGACLRTFEGHASSVTSVALSGDGTRALSGSEDRTLKFWDTTSGACLHTFEEYASSVSSVALSRDGTRALSGSNDGTLELRDTISGRLLTTFEGHAAPVRAVALNEDGTRALSGSDDNALELWDIETGQNLATFQADSSIASCALSSGQEPVICAGDQSGRVHLMRLLEPCARASTERSLRVVHQVSNRVRPALIEALFMRVMDLSPAEQVAFLDAHCAAIPEVRRKVESLLQLDRDLDSGFLASIASVRAMPPDRRSPSFARGTTLGKYRIVRVLGQGGMGVVYEARHMELERFAVIKMLHALEAHDPEAVERLRREARALARLRHPSIVDVYDVGVHTDGQVYIVLERLSGESLGTRLRRTRTLAPGRALIFTRQVARALAAVHAEGIVHRDLKPDNLFIVPDPEVPGGERIKILDFGIAKLIAARREDGAHATNSHVAMGTPPYMSPEQWGDARNVDARTDLYALGVILFRMVTGRLPFEGSDAYEYAHAHAHAPVPRLCDLSAELSGDLDDIVARLLAKKPDERFASADGLLRALDRRLAS